MVREPPVGAGVSLTWRHVTWVLASMLPVCAAAFMVWRIGYGAEGTDEAYYAAMARQFAMGARPFVDNWSALQLFAWMVSPLVRVYTALAGGTTGLVLALRACYVVLSLVVAWVTWAFLRRVVDGRIGLVSVAVPIAATPFLIPTLSYNTLAVAFVALGTSLVGLAVTSPRGSGWAVLGGASFALAIVSYPTLAVVLPFAVLATRLVTGGWRVPVSAALGLIGVGGVVALLLLSSWHAVPDLLAYNAAIASGYGGGAAKLLRLARQAALFVAGQPSAWLTAAVLVWVLATRKAVPWTAMTLLFVSFAWLMSEEATLRSLYLADLVLLSALALGVRHLAEESRAVARWALYTGLVVGVASGYSSSNGFINVGIGALSVMGIGLALLLQISIAHREREPAGHPEVAPAIALALGLAACLAYTGATAAYRDHPPLTLDARVADGPYAGLHTTARTAAFLQALEQSLPSRLLPGRRMLAYDAFPAAYLYGDATPASPQLWLAGVDNTSPEAVDLLARYLAVPGNAPDIVLVSHPGGYQYPADHLVDRLLRSLYVPAETVAGVEVLVPRP